MFHPFYRAVSILFTITFCLGFFIIYLPSDAEAFSFRDWWFAKKKDNTVLRSPVGRRPFRTPVPVPLPTFGPYLPVASVLPTATPALVVIPTPTPSPIPTVTPKPAPTFTPKPTPTLTPTPNPTPVYTPLPSYLWGPSPSVAASPVPTLPPLPTLEPTPLTTAVPTPTPFVLAKKSWEIQSVSSMKDTKDRICYQVDGKYVEKWVTKAKELGVNYVAVETPYDSPDCGDSVSYTRLWVDEIRKQGLKVWHRHMPIKFEGIYGEAKRSDDFIALISNYIKDNPDLFREGDIFTPTPEPQNGGIYGVTYCSQNFCQFNGPREFNKWLRDAIVDSENAFTQIGLGGTMKIGYYGFDGFVAWGDNNPDWNGILEDETIRIMGNITIDHYAEIVGDTMENDLNELQARYPGVPIVIGEWGTIAPNDPEAQVMASMGAAKRPGVVGFNYWHIGTGGNEALIDGDFNNRIQFDEVQSFFKSAN